MLHLRRGDAGDREPHLLSVTRVGSLVVTLALAAGVAACGSGASAGDDLGRPIVLASGRDDHGYLAAATVPVLDAPDGAPVGEVRDGTLLAVLGERSEWLEVQSLEGPPVAGWINDFHLRGTAHLVDPDAPACPVAGLDAPGGRVAVGLVASEQVELLDLHGDGGDLWLGVRPVGDRDATVALVPRRVVQELPGPPPAPGVPCEEIEPDAEAEPHRH